MTTTLNAATSAGGGLIQSADSSGILALQTAGTTAVTIDASQNVGVGATSLSDRLTVGDGTISADAAVRINGGSNTGKGSGIRLMKAGSAYAYIGATSWLLGTGTSNNLSLSTTGNSDITLDASGYLGLGVTPSAWYTAGGYKVMQIGPGMSFDSGNDFRARIASNAFVNSSGDFKYVNTGYASNYNQTSGQHQWFNAASGTAGNTISFTQAMTLDASGNLIVGDTATISSLIRLSVKSASGADVAEFRATTNDKKIIFRNSGETNVGNINIGASATAYNTSSDYRLKENIAPMVGALTTVAQLKPCIYTWKESGEASQGFIAHELQAVVPEAVTGEKDAVNEDGSIKPQGIDTSFLVATLTAAIQEQQAIITTLTERISALEAK